MTRVLETYRDRPGIRIVANLGAPRFLSLLRIANVLVGNSSSGIFEAPSFRLPAVNVGTRQHGRTRATNVIDAAYDRKAILTAIRHVLHDATFRAAIESCVNPYGDGHTALRTIDILKRLRITPALLAKWIASHDPILG